MNRPGSEAFYTPPQLAARWQVPVSRLANWRHQGDGPGYVKLGALVRYPVAEIRAFEAEHARGIQRATGHPAPEPELPRVADLAAHVARRLRPIDDAALQASIASHLARTGLG